MQVILNEHLLCASYMPSYNREQDKHKHLAMELTSIQLSKHGLWEELAGVQHGWRGVRGSRPGGQAMAGGPQ